MYFFNFTGKVYGLIDVLAACCMSVGLIMFSLADNQLSPVFNIKGKITKIHPVCVNMILNGFKQQMR